MSRCTETLLRVSQKTEIARKILLAALVVFAVQACSAGRDFQLPEPRSFQLGETTIAEVMQEYGSPWTESVRTANDRSIKNIGYAFAGPGETLSPGVTATRTLDFFFDDGILVGYTFSSSFLSDHTNYDESLVSEIVEGVDSIEKVRRLFGPPTSELIFPVTDAAGEKALGYGYAEIYRSGLAKLESFTKSLVFTYDDSGTVLDINYSEVDER